MGSSLKKNNKMGSKVHRKYGLSPADCLVLWSVVQNPYCHFSVDEPIGSFSPVQGEQVGDLKGESDREWGP